MPDHLQSATFRTGYGLEGISGGHCQPISKMFGKHRRVAKGVRNLNPVVSFPAAASSLVGLLWIGQRSGSELARARLTTICNHVAVMLYLYYQFIVC